MTAVREPALRPQGYRLKEDSNRRSVIGLDLVRFGAGIGVAMYHLAYWWWLPAVSGEQGRAVREGLAPLREPFRWGWVGIEIFFTLSGFVIAYSAHGKTARGFIKGRMLRLYPTAWICATCTLLIAKLTDPEALSQYAGTVTLWIYGPWISGVYWTLSVEIVFYALVAYALWANIRLTSLGMFLGFVSSLYWLLRVIDFATGQHAKDLFAAVESTPTGRLSLLASGTYFGSGILLWSLAFQRSSRFHSMSLMVFLAASLVAVIGAGHYKIAVEGGRDWQVVEPALLWLIGTVAIIGSIRWNEKLWQLCGPYARPIRFAGLATYPLYLVHSEVGQVIMVRTGSLGPFAALSVALCAVFLLTVTVVLLEPYPRRWIGRLLSVRVRKPALAPAELP
ncbi:MAG: acyltransferase family protein [Janthinobacterium lividum]